MNTSSPDSPASNKATAVVPQGVFCAAVTAFSKGGVDIPRTLAHWQWLLTHGCHGLVVFGTTGEANSISIKERCRTLEAALDQGIPAERLWLGTAACALEDAQTISQHAAALHLAGLLVLPPFYYPNPSPAGLADWYSALLEQTQQALMLYHIPSYSGVPITPTLVETLLQRFPQQVIAIKDSSFNLESMCSFLERFPQLAVFSGSDPQFLPLMQKGGAGVISASANLSAPLIRQVWDLLQAASSASNHDKHAELEAAQRRMLAFRQVLQGSSLIATVKAGLSRRLQQDGWRSVLPPLRPLDAAAADSLWQKLEPLLKFEQQAA